MGWTRNPLGSARRGSNPLTVVKIFFEHPVSSYYEFAGRKAQLGMVSEWLKR
jgi:hypothetical protein